jgi:hypothetical protein
MTTSELANKLLALYPRACIGQEIEADGRIRTFVHNRFGGPQINMLDALHEYDLKMIIANAQAGKTGMAI